MALLLFSVVAMSARATIHDISIQSFFFSPLGTQVYPGDSVRWTLINGTHSTTSDGSSPKAWDSGLMGTPGMTFLVVFTAADAPGPYPYHCSPHAAIMKDTIWVQPPPVNGMMNGAATASREQINPEVAWSEVSFDEAYSVWTEFAGPGYSASVTGVGISLNASLGSWNQSFVPNAVYPDSWSPSIGSNVLGGYLMAQTEFIFPAYSGLGSIVMHASPGGGVPFVVPSVAIGNVPGVNWFDYPIIAMDEDPASPPITVGTGHMIFTEFVDGDGDPNFDGNPFNDPGDIVNYHYTFTNMNPAFGPLFPYPTLSGILPIFGGLPVASPSMSPHRAAMDVVTSAGGNFVIPPGGTYMACLDYASLSVVVEAQVAPGTGWTVLGPVAAAPFSPNPPTSSGSGVMYGSSVSIAVDDGPNCPGNVYVVWSDMSLGIDSDIWFTSSASGGLAWTPPVRVNQDLFAGIPIEQWAPKIDVDRNTGEILVTYYDRRNGGNVDRETFISISTDCGVTWTDCKVSDAGPTPPTTSITWPHLPAARYVGDYQGIDYNTLNGPSFVWNDARNLTDQDVFFAQKWNCSCCVIRGDINHDGAIDITDLTYMVDWLFGGGPPPPCLEEADVDANGSADIADLTFIVDYLFGGGPAPPPC